ncbi:unnamed protein product [Caenorhabditis auriculariae]|uniref:Uncharacterized protein n=1 Tax=Caenorhabditis auriculariae TaxID=2777116 RepID=A0A8S1HRK9_9PELO|nr:unnamed protein product [Caenorhabditis auriculariae]
METSPSYVAACPDANRLARFGESSAFGMRPRRADGGVALSFLPFSVLQTLYENVMGPDVDETSLNCFAIQLAGFDKRGEYPEVRKKALAVFQVCSKNGRFLKSEALLSILKIIAKNSESRTEIYKRLHNQNRFTSQLPFYLQWAETYAQGRKMEKFKMVVELAQENLVRKVSLANIEAGFKLLWKKYFPGVTCNVFSTLDEKIPQKMPGKRFPCKAKPKNRVRSAPYEKKKPERKSFDVLLDSDSSHSICKQILSRPGLNILNDSKKRASPKDPPQSFPEDEPIIVGSFALKQGFSAVTSSPVESGVMSAEEFFGHRPPTQRPEEDLTKMPKVDPPGFKRKSILKTTITH